MMAKFTTLSAALPESDDPDTALQAAIQHALDELQES